MKLEDFSRKKARNFVISWSIIYCLFGLLVIWSLISGYEIQREDPRVPKAMLWSYIFLMFFVLFSLFIGIIGMWQQYFSGKFGNIRKARNISFFVVLFAYPLGVIINVILSYLNS